MTKYLQDRSIVLKILAKYCGWREQSVASHMLLSPPGCSPPNVIPCGRVWQMVDHPNWLTQRLGNTKSRAFLALLWHLSSSLKLFLRKQEDIYNCYNSKVLPLSLHQILIAAAGNSLIDLSPEGGWMWVRCSQSTLAPSRGPCKGDSGSYHENFNQFSSHLKERIETRAEVNKFMKIKIVSRYDEM